MSARMRTAACEIRYWLDGMLDFAWQKGEVLYRHHQDTSVAHDIDENNEGWHHAPKDHHKHSEVLVYALEKSVKGEH
jgi:hypothetical protein